MLRVFILLVLVAAGSLGAAFLVTRPASTDAAADRSASWFAPYVDVTLTPTYAFQSPAANPVNGVFLAFIVAQPSSACTPSWGGYYNLDEADSELNLDARIAQVQSESGHPMISFGGQANTELAVSCTSVSALTAAAQRQQSRHADPRLRLQRQRRPTVPVRRRDSAVHECRRQPSREGRWQTPQYQRPRTPPNLGLRRISRAAGHRDGYR
jgi:hypothetical protein